MGIHEYFSQTYGEARQKFDDAANARGIEVTQTVHPAALGPGGEALSIDCALYAPENARSMLVVTSGTHGVEGFCGSGCQVGLLRDAALFARLQASNVALLLVHAVNPYGFAHLRRVNEDNVDVNRNVANFDLAAGTNPAYRELDPLLMPATWPPTETDNAALMRYIGTHGERAFQDAVTKGQYDMAEGLFYGGNGETWSVRELRALLARHADGFDRLAWIDIHTGLGAAGHGEKIFAGRDADELQRALTWWGNDVKPIHEPGSVSSEIDGLVLNLIYALFPRTQTTAMALEFGTHEPLHVLQALRAEQWLQRNPQGGAALAGPIKRAMRDAFYCDSEDWKGQVYGQTRMAVLQAVAGLANTKR
jgi:hypothetical protein